ncbi:hypothetical protein OIDMADRAFT_146164 [Oidiodendron maius Zn]|uniref:Uncharacterized protein n=1 Tax=Oidiodendron maius (strain Zn) TaxID=913774 RepID=A0A0C3H893_OIDMZ|nr:hypothetical protein OIDMADRAFT_146164 [Oidiodendron maius Zn]
MFINESGLNRPDSYVLAQEAQSKLFIFSRRGETLSSQQIPQAVLVTGYSEGRIGDTLVQESHLKGLPILAIARNLRNMMCLKGRGSYTASLDATESEILKRQWRRSSLQLAIFSTFLLTMLDVWPNNCILWPPSTNEVIHRLSQACKAPPTKWKWRAIRPKRTQSAAPVEKLTEKNVDNALKGSSELLVLGRIQL